MLNQKKIVVVMPAYNAGQTLTQTYDEIDHGIVDEIILVDDHSADDTAEVASSLGISHVIVHERNTGYGGNQKTCYRTALAQGADIVVMLHPDYQYSPKLLMAMCSPIAEGVFDCMLGSRILGTGALKGGMPKYKYLSNRFLTLFQNLLLGHKLSEYHTGYRAFSRRVLEAIPWQGNSDNFLFDNQMLAQVIYGGFSIGEVTCPTRYATDSSSINFANSLRYGLGVLWTSIEFRLHRLGLYRSGTFGPMDVPQ